MCHSISHTEQETTETPLHTGAVDVQSLLTPLCMCAVSTGQMCALQPTLGRAAMEEVKILMSIQHVSSLASPVNRVEASLPLHPQPCIVCIEDVYDSRDALYIVLE